MRARYVWAAFAVFLALLLMAMGWITLTALRLDRAEAEAGRRAVLEENIRLALWRMDSALAPVIARENARPYFDYTPFHPSEQVYTRMFAPIKRGDVLVPSRLLNFKSRFVLLHFQFDDMGRITSPQVPSGNMRDLAETGYMTGAGIETHAERLKRLGRTLNRSHLLAGLRRSGMENVPAGPQVAVANNFNMMSQRVRNTTEFQARYRKVNPRALQQESKRMPIHGGRIQEGVLTPLCVNGLLILARKVTVNGSEYLQGCWLDWKQIKDWLLSDIRELLPDASLERTESVESTRSERMLATVPMRLIPGAIPDAAAGGLSPVQVSLIIAWVCVLLAAVAVGILLSGVISLSERRAAFASAVTHELRTPLTTFRIYTEMLSEGMVREDAQKQDYYSSLNREALRLEHLVENVLAFARLEKGNPGFRLEVVELGALLEESSTRLQERAQQGGMRLTLDVPGDVASAQVRTARSVVEQILFNLVDNACKYACSASEPAVHLEAQCGRKSAMVKVTDNGPGIAAAERKRLFRPFRKSSREAADSAPGVGLGLALSRRLARQIGARLELDKNCVHGAGFILKIPLA